MEVRARTKLLVDLDVVLDRCVPTGKMRLMLISLRMDSSSDVALVDVQEAASDSASPRLMPMDSFRLMLRARLFLSFPLMRPATVSSSNSSREDAVVVVADADRDSKVFRDRVVKDREAKDKRPETGCPGTGRIRQKIQKMNLLS